MFFCFELGSAIVSGAVSAGVGLRLEGFTGAGPSLGSFSIRELEAITRDILYIATALLFLMGGPVMLLEYRASKPLREYARARKLQRKAMRAAGLPVPPVPAFPPPGEARGRQPTLGAPGYGPPPGFGPSSGQPPTPPGGGARR